MTTATSTQNKDDAKKFANLIGPMDPKLDREVRELLVTARIGMLLKTSFFGNLATRLKLVNADEWCPTAATDGRNFYYNSRFIKMLSTKELEFLFGHEVLHCVYDHFGRRGDRDPQLWNIANDYCVNADLKKHRVGDFITCVPCLYDSKYEGMSSEEVYDDLYENAEKMAQTRGSARKAAREGRSAEADKFNEEVVVNLDGARRQMSALTRQIRAIEVDPTMKGEDKRKQMMELVRQQVAVAKGANELYRNGAKALQEKRSGSLDPSMDVP